MHQGWISLYRKFLEWEWYNKSKMVHLFIHLLLQANHADGKWQGKDIARGQLITGLKSLNQQTGISVQSLRTCLNKLKLTKEITIKSTNKFSLITIINYDTYQSTPSQANNQANTQSTINQQTTNNQSTTNNNNNNSNNKKEKNIVDFEKYWSLCKNKIGKQSALKKYKKLNQSDRDLLITAINNYNDYKNGSELKYVKTGNNFLVDGFWRDYIEKQQSANIQQDETGIGKLIERMNKSKTN